MNWGGIVKLSLQDFPNHLAAVVFTLGCDLRCPWCHNGALVNGALSPLPEAEIRDYLLKRRPLLTGVVVSGGEPTLQPDLPEFLHWLKTLGYVVKLDSNGGHPQVLKSLIDAELIDYLALDVKAHPDDYPRVTGRPMDRAVLAESIVQARRVAHEFRLTVVPGLNSTLDAEKYAAFLQQGPLYLQGFRKGDTLLDQQFTGRSCTAAELEALKAQLAVYLGDQVFIR